MAKTVEELEVFQRATDFWKAVDALLESKRLDRDLREQIKDAIDSVVSNITEGFEQPTDRAFAKYLFDAKASTAEARRRLWMAAQRRFITEDEYQKQNELGDQVARMTAGLIKYLLRSNRRDRGLGSPGYFDPGRAQKQQPAPEARAGQSAPANPPDKTPLPDDPEG